MKEFLQVVKIFHKELKNFKFRTYRKKLQDHYGECEEENGLFTIIISDEVNEDLAMHIFIHELAHMLVWDEPGDDHSEKWGKAYSKLYRIFIDKYIKK